MATLQSLASEARSFFVYSGQNNPDLRDNIWTCKDETPEWVRDLVRSAHGSMFPDDYVYEFTVDALNLFSDLDDESDMEDAIYDIEPDYYTAGLLEWLGSHTQRVGFTDEAFSNAGYGSLDSVLEIIQAGQQLEKQGVANAVLDALREELDNREESEEDEGV